MNLDQVTDYTWQRIPPTYITPDLAFAGFWIMYSISYPIHPKSDFQP